MEAMADLNISKGLCMQKKQNYWWRSIQRTGDEWSKNTWENLEYLNISN